MKKTSLIYKYIEKYKCPIYFFSMFVENTQCINESKKKAVKALIKPIFFFKTNNKFI